MDSLRGAKLPGVPKGGSALVKVALLGGAGLYAVLNSFYNVEGGHRAIVFNRLEGIKDKVRPPRSRPRSGGPMCVSVVSSFLTGWVPDSHFVLWRRCTPKELT
jgi:hypothetical protein